MTSSRPERQPQRSSWAATSGAEPGPSTWSLRHSDEEGGLQEATGGVERDLEEREGGRRTVGAGVEEAADGGGGGDGEAVVGGRAGDGDDAAGGDDEGVVGGAGVGAAIVSVVAGEDERRGARGLLVGQPERVGERAGEVLEEGAGEATWGGRVRAGRRSVVGEGEGRLAGRVERVEAGAVEGVGALGVQDGEPLAGEGGVVGLALLVGHLGQPEQFALGVEAAGEEGGVGGEERAGGLGAALALGVALGLGEGSGPGVGLALVLAGVVERDPALGDRTAARARWAGRRSRSWSRDHEAVTPHESPGQRAMAA